MNWKRGIYRLVWTVSTLAALVAYILADSGYISDSISAGAVTFGVVWLIYGLGIFVYKGFQDSGKSVN